MSELVEKSRKSLVSRAIEFATLAHAGQTRKGTEIPYILHCVEAGVIASSLTNVDGEIDEEVAAAAILHDTIEDADIKYETLVKVFNENIADLVQAQSEDKSKTWDERKNATIDFLKQNESRDVEIATLADKLSNMRAIHKDYKVMGEDLWSKFNAGKEHQHWYYSSIGKALTQVKGTNEHDEYTRLIYETFGVFEAEL